MNFSEYLQIDAVNWSSLKHLAKTPGHYRCQKETPSRVTDPMLAGMAAHTAILEPQNYHSRFRVWTGGARRGREWNDFCEAARSGGATTITESMNERAIGMMMAVHETNGDANKYLGSEGRAEHTILWTHGPTKTKCKSRLDWLTDDPDDVGALIVDVKTTSDAGDRFAERTIYDNCYHAQAAFYCDAYAYTHGGMVPRFVFVAIEQTPPYAVGVYELPVFGLEAGRAHYEGLLRELQACINRNQWAAQYNNGQTVQRETPPWAPGMEDVGLELVLDAETLEM